MRGRVLVVNIGIYQLWVPISKTKRARGDSTAVLGGVPDSSLAMSSVLPDAGGSGQVFCVSSERSEFAAERLGKEQGAVGVAVTLATIFVWCGP